MPGTIRGNGDSAKNKTGEKPYSQVAYILVGSAGNLEPGMQYNFLSKDLVLTATLR